MTDNNWITPEWIEEQIVKSGYRFYGDKSDFFKSFAAEINKEIKNILESAEKRDCTTCYFGYMGCSQNNVSWARCIKNSYENWSKHSPNWTPKEQK